MSVTFEKGETTVALPDPAPGYPVEAARRQTLGRTAGGTVYVYDKGQTRYAATLRFESLTDVQKNALASFFTTTTQGARETFTYADSNGTEYTARFLEETLEFLKVAGGVWDARLTLQLDAIGG